MNSADCDQPMQNTSTRTLRLIKLSGFTVSSLMLAGIVTLMVLASGKNEDITGIVAPALLLALISGGAATIAAIWEKRSRHNP